MTANRELQGNSKECQGLELPPEPDEDNESEDFAIYVQSLHSLNERMRKR